MTYSKCPFEPVVTGRDAKAKGVYKFIRWWIRYNRRELEAKVDRAVTEAMGQVMVTGTGYFRIQERADGGILFAGGSDVSSEHG